MDGGQGRLGCGHSDVEEERFVACEKAQHSLGVAPGIEIFARQNLQSPYQSYGTETYGALLPFHVEKARN